MSLQDRMDAAELGLIHQALRSCVRPDQVRIVDSGRPARADRPRYRLEMVDHSKKTV